MDTQNTSAKPEIHNITKLNILQLILLKLILIFLNTYFIQIFNIMAKLLIYIITSKFIY